jgi:hypothetical protein
MVFSCFRNDALQRDKEKPDGYQMKLQQHLLRFVKSTPLNILVWTLRELGLHEYCRKFLDNYEEFLTQINDPSVRERLADLSEQAVYRDSVFLQCREISHQLQATLKSVFFEADTPLREFTAEYGVF